MRGEEVRRLCLVQSGGDDRRAVGEEHHPGAGAARPFRGEGDQLGLRPGVDGSNAQADAEGEHGVHILGGSSRRQEHRHVDLLQSQRSRRNVGADDPVGPRGEAQRLDELLAHSSSADRGDQHHPLGH